jgi:transposase
MRTVDEFAKIRQAHRDGLSSRQIAKQLGVGRDTIRKALQHAEPPPYTLTGPRPAPVFGPFRSFVDEILASDENAPRKQRHTASQIYRRLVAEKGYTGKYDQVRRYLQQRRLDRRETFIPLEHRPGVRAEADTERLASDTAVSLDPVSAAPNITVPLPDLSQFDRLLPHSQGGDDHERCQCDAVEGQPQAVALADDAGRVGQTGP